jgi:Flp pilus assembly pilin Flp
MEKDMKLFKLYKNFREDEDGAVTVDWVVLTAAIVGLAIAIGTVIFDQTRLIGNAIDGELAGAGNLNTPWIQPRMMAK